ncbi:MULTISPECIES: F0F1 ATP synthase subunit delta [Microbulbifer]|uniref:F0F1 ATP synthase subunit delta n=1 Tax=Microbulbifer TaxID=48073 RepID=UPI001C96787F|nr:F0F1 ATP synthase subunit delta [Microbulbifer agarilyticus]MBY6211453.1 F0F1 ATP synthase subunit delta [Microbulbifer agarilyticus]MCA0893530.1 F0F1 ATP synthase subunit delta [Microbulbifer agarilyticus]MCA0900140.1 F0F1 ATP synthase subunit delta [Microbulbifer agarilyticus]
MAELSTLARPYAKAAFAHAQEASDLSGWSAALVTAAAVSQNEKVGELLDNPQLTSEVRAEKFLSVCGDYDAAMQNFIKLLAENHRLPLLPEISELFEDLKAQAEATLEVEVISARPLSDEQSQRLTQALSKKFAREVHLHSAVDESLLGGAIIRAGDTVIDGTVRGRLAKLAEAMNS